jgi:hypothetical protein
MIFHCLSVPYSPTRKDVSLCAFVQKVYKFCDEMTKRGHTVYHYGHENSIVNCTEHINVTSNDILINSYGNLNDLKTLSRFAIKQYYDYYEYIFRNPFLTQTNQT